MLSILPYWEKPRSSLSSRSLSGFLDAVLIFIPSPILGRRKFFASRAPRSSFALTLSHSTTDIAV
jgi:hypothetical protein